MPIISYDIKRQRIVTTKSMVSLVCIDLKGKKTDRACIQMQNSVYSLVLSCDRERRREDVLTGILLNDVLHDVREGILSHPSKSPAPHILRKVRLKEFRVHCPLLPHNLIVSSNEPSERHSSP